MQLGLVIVIINSHNGGNLKTLFLTMITTYGVKKMNAILVASF